jgi:hypothetical protein
MPVNTARSEKMLTLCVVTDPLRKAQGRRLAAARKQAGFRSARAAALENGWKESSYRAHEGGTRTIGLDDANRYARKFRALGVSVTAQSILFDAEASQPILNGELDEAILQAALLAVAEEAAELPANEAAVEAMLEPLTRSVARYVLKALEQRARGNDNRPDPGSVRNHIRSAFQALFALGRG